MLTRREKRARFALFKTALFLTAGAIIFMPKLDGDIGALEVVDRAAQMMPPQIVALARLG